MQIKNNKKSEMLTLIEKIRNKREAALQSGVVQEEDEFIEI